MFMFSIDHKAYQAFWIHDPAHSAPSSTRPVRKSEPDRGELMASWGASRLAEELRRETDLSKNPPRPFFPLQLVMHVYPSKN